MSVSPQQAYCNSQQALTSQSLCQSSVTLFPQIQKAEQLSQCSILIAKL